MNSVMNHSFSRVPKLKAQRSVFDRSFGHKTAFDADYLIPVMVDEVIPGDTMTIKMSAFARMSSQLNKPMMDNLKLDSFFFFVPYRLIHTDWVKLMGERDDPDDDIDFVTPVCTAPAGGYTVGSLQDYVGIRPGVVLTHVNYVGRAYNLIWNRFFRDQNLQDSVVVDKDAGPDDPADYVLLKRGKRHDYFTSGLSQPQKGDAATIPLGTTAPIVDATLGTGAHGVWKRNSTGAAYPGGLDGRTDGSGRQTYDTVEVYYVPNSTLRVDLTAATAATVNSYREAVQVQHLLERDARSGTRYGEILSARFGVDNPDSRLQYPEYLGGSSADVIIHPVVGTNQTGTGATSQGKLNAFATIAAHGHGFSKSFTEFGMIIGLVSVRADINYQQGLHRMFTRRNRLDFFAPEFVHLGEQEVLKQEIFAAGTSADTEVFNYQERYADYRYKPSQISGILRSDAASSLEVYHLAEDFPSCPPFNDTFIVQQTPMDRILAVTGSPHFILDSYFKYICARPLPVFSVPGLMDHF